MILKNKDGVQYIVATECDCHGGFMVFAQPVDEEHGEAFCIHYRSLAELNEEWEDVD